ncbi:hypothetical protein IW136_001121 [Coemansia sp. RSA 678]|nr:hypothetical protein IW136_001121 [Coemansia sp. RSA 678]
MHTIQLTCLLVAAVAASGEMYFNVPAGVDQEAVQAAFMEGGVKRYNPVERPNANGLHPAVNMARPQAEMMEAPAAPQAQPQQIPQIPQEQQMEHWIQQPQQQPNKAVAVPLAAEHRPGGDGLQSAASTNVKPESTEINRENAESTEIKPASTEVKAQTIAAMPAVAAAPVALAAPRNTVVTTIVAMPTAASAVAPKAAVPSVAKAISPVSAAAVPVSAAAVPSVRATTEEDNEIIEEEEIEDDDASDVNSVASPAAAKLVPAISVTSPAAATTQNWPLMLAKASATAFKPADLDKFTFPSSEAAVNPESSAEAPASAVHLSTMRAAQPSPSVNHASKEASSKVKSLTMGNGVLSKSHATQSSTDSVENAAAANARASLVALAVLGLLF